MSVAYAVLLGALLLTGIAFYYVGENIHTQERARFDETMQRTQQAVDRRMNTYIDTMFSVRGLFNASQSVERDEFRDYIVSLNPERRYPGIQAIGYAERVGADGLEAHQEELRAAGFEGYRVSPGGPRDEYFPVLYVEPWNDMNRRMFFGRDMHALTVHRSAMDQARDVNLPRASGKVMLEGSEEDAGFIIYVPVYRNDVPQSTVPERREALQGYIVTVFRANEVLGDIFVQQGDPHVDFKVFDGAEFDDSYLLFDRTSDGTGEAYTPLFTQTTTLQVAGRLWILRFSTLPGFETEMQENLPWIVLWSGLALSLILFLLTWMLGRSRSRAERTGAELEAANRELEAFSYTVSHDLRAPLRSINGFSRILLEDYADRLDAEGRDHLRRVDAASRNMGLLIDDLLDFSRLRNRELKVDRVDLSEVVEEICEELSERQPRREVEFTVQPGVVARADRRLIRIALENLLSNAFKFTANKEKASIEFGVSGTTPDTTYFVRDDGAGFDMAYEGKLFGAFQRLHRADEFEGSGIGLATVKRIIERHGGEVWAVGAVGRGATFFFTLGEAWTKKDRRKRRKESAGG